MTKPEAPARTPAGPPPDRYGRRPGGGRPRGALIGGVIVVLLTLSWAAWVGLRQAQTPVRWKAGAFTALDDGRAQLQVTVTTDPGQRVVCTVRMLNGGLTEVGRLDATLGPSSERTFRTTVTVPTFEAASSARIRACAVR